MAKINEMSFYIENRRNFRGKQRFSPKKWPALFSFGSKGFFALKCWWLGILPPWYTISYQCNGIGSRASQNIGKLGKLTKNSEKGQKWGIFLFLKIFRISYLFSTKAVANCTIVVKFQVMGISMQYNFSTTNRNK